MESWSASDGLVRHWFTIFRIDLDTGEAHVTKYIESINAQDAAIECNKMNRFVRSKEMDHYLWVWREEDKPPILVP